MLRRYWRVSAGTVRLLEALRSGWQPGTPVPAQLANDAREIEAGGGLEQVVRQLAEMDLLVQVSRPPRAPEPAPAGFERVGWRDLRLPLFTVSGVPGRAGRFLMRLAVAMPVMVVVVTVLSLVLLVRGAGHPVFGGWARYAAAVPPWHVLALLLGASIVLTAIHELGHAVVLGTAMGAPVTVGARLFWGFPQAYTDTRAIHLLPERGARLAVLLGGVTAEMFTWTAATTGTLAAHGAVPPFVLACVLFGGPFTLVRNLLPFFKNDGYFVLQETTRITQLRDKAEAAVVEMLIPGTGGHRPDRVRWWLPWYGLLHIHLLAAVWVLLGLGIGVSLGRASLGALAGLGAGLAFLVGTYRRLLQRNGAGSGARP